MKGFALSFPKLLLLTFTLVSIVFFLSFKWQNNEWKYNVAGDGKGYYIYLTAAFIYHDFSFQFIQNMDTNLNAQTAITQLPNGQKINKYFAGEALLLMPFFLLAYLISFFIGFPLDGYSFIFQASVSVAALFYAIAGLWCLAKFLQHFINSNNVIAFVLLLVFGGSNLLYYTWLEPSMSHVYSFFAINLFMALAASFFTKPGSKKLWLLFVVFGLICLIRPVNALIILVVPFICFVLKIKSPITLLMPHKTTIIIGLLSFFFILSIQLLLYKLQIGQWWIWAYNKEGFNFSNPHFFEFLFSFRKGWFIYTPVAFLSVLSAAIIWRNKLRLLLSFILPIAIILYVSSSWHDWAYGASYGARPMTEYIGFVMIPIAMGLQNISSYLLKGVIVFVAWSFLLLNCIQTYQINKHILLWDNMTFNAYKASFLKTGDDAVNMLD